MLYVVSRGAETRKEVFAQRTTLLATSVCLFNKAGESVAFDFNEVVNFPRVYVVVVVVVVVVAEEEGSCVSLSQRIATQGCLSLIRSHTDPRLPSSSCRLVFYNKSLELPLRKYLPPVLNFVLLCR